MVFVRINEERDIDPAYVENLEKEITRLHGLLHSVGEGASDVATDDEQSDRFHKMQALVLRLSEENKTLRDKQKEVSGIVPSLEDNSSENDFKFWKNLAENHAITLSELQKLTDQFFSFDVEEEALRTGLETLYRRVSRQQTTTSVIPAKSKTAMPPLKPSTRGNCNNIFFLLLNNLFYSFFILSNFFAQRLQVPSQGQTVLVILLANRKQDEI